MHDQRDIFDRLPTGLLSSRARLTPVAALMLVLLCIPGGGLPIGQTVLAQPAAEGFANWKAVETSPQFKEMTTALAGGGPFNDSGREFFARVVLPQFNAAENLPSLDEVRKKIREQILLRIKDDAVFDEVSRFVRDHLEEVVRDVNADLLQRVNAMVFLGEMTDKNRKPWPAAVETLVAAASDATLDPAVRIAAVGGIGNHVSKLNAMSVDQATATRAAVATALPKLLPPPAADGQGTVAPRSLAASWLAARSFSLLPQVANPLPPDSASLLVGVIEDPSWPFDVRIRAAAALGKTAGPESGVNPQAVLASIRGLAIAALDADRVEGQRLTELESFHAGGNIGPKQQPPGRTAGDPAAALRPAVCRRAAWRLYTLGDSIVPETKTGGLAKLQETDDAVAQRLAKMLKETGEALDTTPSGQILLRALDALDPDGREKRAAAAQPAVAAEQPAGNGSPPGSDGPVPNPNNSPFGDSPF